MIKNFPKLTLSEQLRWMRNLLADKRSETLRENLKKAVLQTKQPPNDHFIAKKKQ